MTLAAAKRWLGAVALFFAWAFVVHGLGLVLHEVGGHGVVAEVLGCGIAGIDLTYFGHGIVHYAACSQWTFGRLLVADWAGLGVTIAAGLAALVVARVRRLAPLSRLLAAILATAFLLGQLAYMTSGGFHDLYDPGRTARVLRAHGLHAVAWAPPLAMFTGAAFFGARTIIDAFREHFAPRTRAHALAQMAATIGVAGVVYAVAFYVEWALRLDVAMRGVTVEAQRIAAAKHEAPPFPIDRVLAAIAVVAVVAALARPLRDPASATRAVPTRVGVVVGAAALACGLAIALLDRV